MNPYEIAAGVVDPELRAVTIAELGVLRDVAEDPDTGRVTVTITPTYSGCPAMDAIRAEIRRALGAAGYADAEVVTVLAPAWSTDAITEAGRAKLAAAGISPPTSLSILEVSTSNSMSDLPRSDRGVCPRCGSGDTEQLSRFGSTACKALWRCRACAEPFELFKTLR